MADEQRQRAVDRFYRLGGNGAGLGLAMVQRIAKLHGGETQLIDGLNGRGLGVEVVAGSVRAGFSPNRSLTRTTRFPW